MTPRSAGEGVEGSSAGRARAPWAKSSMLEALGSAGGNGGAVGSVEMQAGGAGAHVALQAGGAGGGLARVARQRGSERGAGGGHGCLGLVVGGPRGKGRVEYGSKSPKKPLLRDFSSFTPY